jgi:hypothetical protein
VSGSDRPDYSNAAGPSPPLPIGTVDSAAEPLPEKPESAAAAPNGPARPQPNRGKSGRFVKGHSAGGRPLGARGGVKKRAKERERTEDKLYRLLDGRGLEVLERAAKKGGHVALRAVETLVKLLDYHKENAAREDGGVEVRVLHGLPAGAALRGLTPAELADFRAAVAAGDADRALAELTRAVEENEFTELTHAPAVRLDAAEDERDDEPAPPPRGDEGWREAKAAPAVPLLPEPAMPDPPSASSAHVVDFGFTPRAAEIDVSGTDTLRRMNDLWRRR